MLNPGTRLGPYEVDALIGSGGMGEVYRARDTRLDRIVALKVLPQHVVQDPGLRDRLEREARALAALHHPHICHLNDIGRDGDIDFLVMEYLEGETLADRLARAHGKGLSIDDSLRYAIQIAEALSEAHRRDIVHRDLKPRNIFLDRGGAGSGAPIVKLLDFGLAKRRAAVAGSPAGGSTLPTRQQPLTERGAILGTWPYMSPEQLEGREADARSDIFAFGAVLYEMVTGRKAFEGDSHAGVIAAILEKDPPPIGTLRPLAPPPLDRLARKCLAKEPDARWQTARDLADELKWIAEADAAAGGAVPRREPALHDFPSAAWPWAAAAFAAALLAIIATAAITWSMARREDPVRPVRRFVIEPTGGARVFNHALSPDGRFLAFRGRSDRRTQLHLRRLDQLEARALPGTEGADSPTFSPDGEWIAFLVFGGSTKLMKVSVTSGAPPMTLADLTGCCAGGSFAWLPDGRIVVPLIATGFVAIPGEGGTSSPLTKPDASRREIDHHSPTWLPGGRALLLGIHRGVEAFDVAVHRFDTGERRVLVQDAFEPRYVPTGHLVYVRQDSLMAAPFDVDRLALTGPEVVVVERLHTAPDSGAAAYRLAQDGTLAYTPAVSLQGRTLAWVDRRGGVEPLPIGPRAFGAPSLSPDGRRLAVHIDDGARRDIWVYELGSGSLTRMTFDGASAAPIWTPDGRRLVFSATTEGRRQIHWLSVDGGQPELIVPDEQSVWAGGWSPDLRTLAFTRQPSTDLNDIGLLRLDGRPSTSLVVSGKAMEQWPRISPDGRWLAYTSNETGRNEVYVMPLSGEGGKRQISPDGGTQPVWGRSGRELFYRVGARFFVVPVAGLPASIGKPAELPVPVRVAAGSSEYYGHPGYDVSPDGQRLLVVQQAEDESAPSRIHVVLNWFEELEGRVPTRR